MENPARNKHLPYGQPKQFYWDARLKEQFEGLTHLYDPTLSTTKAILKLVMWAVQENWLPGYVPKGRTTEPFQNKAAEATENLRPDRTMFKA